MSVSSSPISTKPPLSGFEDLIPSERRTEVNRVLAQALHGFRIEAIEPIIGGASGARIYKVLTHGGTAYLLRLDGRPDGFRDPARQYACQRIAAEAGVAPALIHDDAQARISLSAFVAATPVAASRRERLGALARAVKSLHDAPPFPVLMPYFDAMDRVLASFAVSGVLPPNASRRMLDLYGRIARIYPRSAAETVASHNDLNPGNVLFVANRAVIIDWESAFAADRYVDLSAALNFFTENEQEEQWLLEIYFDRQPTALERSRTVLMRQVNRLFYAAMLIGAAAQEIPNLRIGNDEMATPPFSKIRGDGVSVIAPQGKVRLGCAFLNEALAGEESARFELSLGMVAASER